MLKKGNTLVSLNRAMKLFLLKLIGLVVGWEVIYIFILEPKRWLDEPLTNWLSAAVTWCLNLLFQLKPALNWVKVLGQPVNEIHQQGRTILLVYDDCNGLDLFVIYLAFIFLLPYPIRRKLIFSIGGLIAIFIGNIIRCIALYYVYVNFRSSFDFNHHYVFTIIMYLIIFYGWVLFTKKPRMNEVG
jgi:exosortase/archaeosortase family protein